MMKSNAPAGVSNTAKLGGGHKSSSWRRFKAHGWADERSTFMHERDQRGIKEINFEMVIDGVTFPSD